MSTPNPIPPPSAPGGKTSKTRRSRRPANPLRATLNSLVMPVLHEHQLATPDPEDSLRWFKDDNTLAVRACLRGQQMLEAGVERLDDTRSLLRLRLPAGVFAEGRGSQAMVVGTLIDHTPFHVCLNTGFGFFGHMLVGCDLVVRADDHSIVKRRITELLALSRDFDWFFPLRMPTRLRLGDIADLEIPWEDLPHGNLGEFVDNGMASPPIERTPLLLCRLAHGLGRWDDLLRLLREHPEELPAKANAPLKALACRELERWRPALEAAKIGGYENGRYPGVPRLSPSCLHAQIEAGQDIEALKLLGKPVADEPGFYDWLRGLALFKAGDKDGADHAFTRYFDKWPGDVIGVNITRALTGADD